MERYKTVQVLAIPFGNLTQIHAIQIFLVLGMNIMSTTQQLTTMGVSTF